jgi:S-adenosylmethionine:diacylglycerol 3-amino-3-carboxypropyl transferase
MPAADAESLIAHLSGGLHPNDRVAFRRAAEEQAAPASRRIRSLARGRTRWHAA